MLESKFQARIIKKIKARFPNAFVLKNDPNYMQGIPDLLVLIGDQWFMLECKQNANSPLQPNQGYYNSLFGEMSFCRFVYPENESEVLDEIQRSLRH